MRTKQFSVILFIISCQYCFCQKTETNDSTRLVSYANKIIIKVNVSNERDAYFLFNKDDNTRLNLTSNNNNKLFISLDYEILGFSFGFTPSFFSSNQDDLLKGESSFNDFKFRIFLGKWIQTLRYKKIKGYYIDNTQDFLENWVKGRDPYIQISNLTTSSWGMSTSYVFNPNFSIRNLFYQTEWQKFNAGSFVPNLDYDYNRISFDFENTESKDDNFNLKLDLAYYYTFVIKEHWFIAPHLSPALGLRFTKSFSLADGIVNRENNTYLIKYLSGGLHLGYSSRKIIFGTNFNFTSSYYRQDKSSHVENDQVYGVIYFGYRFDTPKFIDGSYHWLMRQFGF